MIHRLDGTLAHGGRLIGALLWLASANDLVRHIYADFSRSEKDGQIIECRSGGPACPPEPGEAGPEFWLQLWPMYEVVHNEEAR